MLFGSTFLPVARREWIGYLIAGVWGGRILGILAMTLLSRENRQKIASLYEFRASRCGGDTRRTDYYDPRSVPLSFSFVRVFRWFAPRWFEEGPGSWSCI